MTDRSSLKAVAQIITAVTGEESDKYAPLLELKPGMSSLSLERLGEVSAALKLSWRDKERELQLQSTLDERLCDEVVEPRGLCEQIARLSEERGTVRVCACREERKTHEITTDQLTSMREEYEPMMGIKESTNEAASVSSSSPRETGLNRGYTNIDQREGLGGLLEAEEATLPER